MRDYNKVFTSFWTSPDIRAMSEDGRTLALYLLTCQHSNMIGCFRIPEAYVADDMQWGFERVTKGFHELFQNGFATHDSRSKWVVLHKFLRWNPIENPNQGKSAMKLFGLIPDESTKALAANALSLYGDHIDKTVLEPFFNRSQTLSKPGTGTGEGTGTGTRTGEGTGDANAMLPGGAVAPVPADGEVQAVAVAKPKKPARQKSETSEANIATWGAYATAYANRYGVQPARNAAVNGMIARLVAAVGQQDAPRIAKYFVNLNNEQYVRKMHDLKLLLNDWQGIRTLWMTNRQMTAATARSIDKQQAALSGVDDYLRDAYPEQSGAGIKTIEAEVLP